MNHGDPAQGALALLFLNVFAEQMGFPVPSYPALLIAGSLASLTVGDAGYVAVVWLIAMVACELADSIWYGVGRRYGHWSMAQVCRVSLEPDTCIRKNRNLYLSVGPKLLIVAKIVPGLGALSTLMAGATRTRYLTFLLFDGIGSALWVSSGLVLGMIFQRTILATLHWLETYLVQGIFIVAGALFLFVFWKAWRRHRFLKQSRLVPRVEIDELLAMQAETPDLRIVDVREPSVVDETIPDAIAIPLDAAIDRAMPDTDAETPIVVFCACPNEVSAALVALKLQAAGYRHTYALVGGYDAWQATVGTSMPTGDADTRPSASNSN
ncbi:rhodanese-like domain-containing protein [Salinisphaera hydrothermalis]|uniref:rhodanese-like domain-containing protein n=1 Tax=Salinisphaera hydrothermalis TaxID=563188 RepID=UPI00333E9747